MDRFDAMTAAASPERRVVEALAAGRREDALAIFLTFEQLAPTCADAFGVAALVGTCVGLALGYAPGQVMQVAFEVDRAQAEEHGVDWDLTQAAAAFVPAAFNQDLQGAWHVWAQVHPPERQVELVWVMACLAARAVRDGA